MQASESLPELRQLLGMLENNLRDTWLCPTYIREPQLVKNAFIPTGREVAAIPLSAQHESMRLRPADVHHGALCFQHPVALCLGEGGSYGNVHLVPLVIRAQDLGCGIPYPVEKLSIVFIEEKSC